MPNDLLEKTLEDIIYENRKTIHLRGFRQVKSNAYRQVILPSGKRIDILGFEINNGALSCDIYELKKKVINADAICQAYGYYTELKGLTYEHFSSFTAKIIMVGREYEPVSIIDSLPIPIEVFTYEYFMDGIKFKELHNPYVYSKPNPSFSFGLWAFGFAGLSFNSDVSSVSFHSVYDKHSKSQPEYAERIKGHIDSYVKPAKEKQQQAEAGIEIRIIEKIVEKVIVREQKIVKTEIFPEQPQWSAEFGSRIPHINVCDDFEKFEDCDLEDDELEQDMSDYEPEEDNDLENENDEQLPIMGKEFNKSLVYDCLAFVSILTPIEYRKYFENY